MTVRNTEYRITFTSKAGRFYYYFAKDGSGWYQITAAGNRHKPGVKVTVEYAPDSTVRDS